MADVTFETPPPGGGTYLRILLPAGQASTTAITEMYSAWKEWFKTGSNSKWPFAFDTTGGDPVTATANVAAYFFVRNDNGWRIRPPEEDLNTVIVGNVYGRDPSLDIIVPTAGAFTSLVQIERDASSVVGAGSDSASIADAVWDEARSGHVAAGSFGEGVLIASGGISATSFAAGAIDAAAIGADAIGSAELADSAGDDIADRILARDLVGGSSGSSRSIRNALRTLRNRVRVASGTATIYEEDDATPAYTATVTTAAGNPITEVDPA